MKETRREKGTKTMKLNQDEMLAAQQALADHTQQIHTQNNLAASVTQNNYEAAPGRWNAPRLSITEARAARHAEIRKANEAAAAKPAPAKLTAEEEHQQLVAIRRANANAQRLNTKNFGAKKQD
jgi:hypothetical protein